MLDRFRKVLILAGLSALFLCLVGFGMLYLVNRNDPSNISEKKIKDQAAKRPLQKQKAVDPEPGDATSNFLVPEDRVPKDQSSRAEASQLELLPNRIPAKTEASISPSERKRLMADVGNFLRRWETFKPGSEDAYTASLQPYTAEGALTETVRRADSRQEDKMICALDKDCMIGQKWIPFGDIASAASVRDYQVAGEAYVTAYGAVEYQTVTEDDPLAGRKVNRSYGLLLEKPGKRWLVTRAVAETVGPLD